MAKDGCQSLNSPATLTDWQLASLADLYLNTYCSVSGCTCLSNYYWSHSGQKCSKLVTSEIAGYNLLSLTTHRFWGSN